MLSKKRISAIRQQMKARGYINPSDDDAIVYDSLGEEKYNQILELSFRASTYEAEELMVPKRGAEFDIVCKVNKIMMMQKARQIMEERWDRRHEFEIIPFTDYQLKMFVKQKYAHFKPTGLERKCNNG